MQQLHQKPKQKPAPARRTIEDLQEECVELPISFVGAEVIGHFMDKKSNLVHFLAVHWKEVVLSALAAGNDDEEWVCEYAQQVLEADPESYQRGRLDGTTFNFTRVGKASRVSYMSHTHAHAHTITHTIMHMR